MLPAIDRRTAPAAPLTSAQRRKRFWWGVANPSAKQRQVMVAILVVETLWLAVMFIPRIAG